MFALCLFCLFRARFCAPVLRWWRLPGARHDDGEEALYGPMRKFQYALEARRGFLRDKHLRAGDSRLVLESLP